MAENNSKRALITKVLFLIGIIVLIFIFAFALIKFVPKIVSGFASVGQFIASPFTSKTIKISSNNTDLNSGEKFILSWKYENNKDGDFSVRFDCKENLMLQIITDKGPKNMLCNTPYNVKKSTSVEFIASLEKQNTFVKFPVTIEYIDSDNKDVLASGEIELSVTHESENAGEVVIISEPVDTDDEENDEVITNNNTSPKPTNTNSTYYGPADLAISNAYALNDTAVTFTVSNIGGTASGVWYFNYTDPDGVTKLSPAQVSLSRGQGLRFTLTFDNDVDEGDVRIVIDPQNNIAENNRFNNTDIIQIEGGDGSGSSVDNDYDRNDDADLKVMSFEVGKLSGSRFTEDDEIDEDDEAAVRFIVKNIGGESTGSWKYTVSNLPYNNDDDYESKTQSSLRPGESREITLGFDNADEGNYDIKIEVDSDDDVDEENESNNTKTEELEVRN